MALEVTLWSPVLRKSFLWDHVIVKHLHTNMRVQLQGDKAPGEFASQLLAIGDGKYSIDTSPDIIQLPESQAIFLNLESKSGYTLDTSSSMLLAMDPIFSGS